MKFENAIIKSLSITCENSLMIITLIFKIKDNETLKYELKTFSNKIPSLDITGEFLRKLMEITEIFNLQDIEGKCVVLQLDEKNNIIKLKHIIDDNSTSFYV